MDKKKIILIGLGAIVSAGVVYGLVKLFGN